MSPTYDQIRAAMLASRPIAFMYQGYRREVCAHVIGLKNGHEQVLTFQYGGGSSSGLPAGGQWRCMPIGGVGDLEILNGPWRTGLNTHQKTQTCVDQVDVELWVGADGKPYVKSA
jgi:hypothetical protein